MSKSVFIEDQEKAEMLLIDNLIETMSYWAKSSYAKKYDATFVEDLREIADRVEAAQNRLNKFKEE